MADILIRGIEMPKENDTLVFDIWHGKVYTRSTANTGTRSYEVIPLPEGHGKLIDIKDVKSEKFHIEGQAEMYSVYNIGWNDALDVVCMNAPSIVPAEGGMNDA